MFPTLEAEPLDAPTISPLSSVSLARAAASLWRVIDRDGRVIGHLQAIGVGDAMRYRARRFHASIRGFRDLGEFWTADDAVDCLRYAR
ncbi:hypothetical protein GCM10009775_02350 [Microbacterium aoyamense]|uniref:Uncharacterized protein n=1 Tax=Microbacterium aoyamense TaxID=344166 RepID=A0ABN2P7F9_9MICO|nr:hypothetical protein [Microbacterium aoyamense]